MANEEEVVDLDRCAFVLFVLRLELEKGLIRCPAIGLIRCPAIDKQDWSVLYEHRIVLSDPRAPTCEPERVR
eukprot:3571566-Prymnesium_polylepis.4